MTDEHRSWIEEYVASQPTLRGMCAPATKKMHTAFPELTICRGHVQTASGLYEHWWLEDENGGIVDPTAAQYADERVLDYKKFQPGDSVRVGKCMECGSTIFAEVESLDDPKYHREFCDDECRASFGTSLGWG